MSRPRKPHKRTNIMLHEDVLAKLDLILTDPVTSRLRYGAMTEISNRLFSMWIKGFDEAENKIDYLQKWGVKLRQQ